MKIYVYILLTVFAGALFTFFGTINHLPQEQIIFTQVPGDQTDLTNPFPDKARIVSLNTRTKGTGLQILTSAFQSARSPQISYDGRRLLFSGKLNNKYPWQIWEMDLVNRNWNQITFQESDCTDPSYLPDGRILFSQVVNDSINGINKEFALFTINLLGNVERITFQPHADLLSTVFQDGRIITSSRQLYPELKDPKWLAMRPDGTKSELYYQGDKNFEPVSRGYETEDERFIFVERKNTGYAGKIACISTNRPLHSMQIISSESASGGFHSIYPNGEDNLVVSFSENQASSFKLWNFNLEENSLDSMIYSDPEWHSIEGVTVSIKKVPKKLPSRVDLTAHTGKMICLNSAITDLSGDSLKPQSIQILGTDKILGSILVEPDGSFYIEISADRPFRFRAIDKNGNEILKPSSWLWVRPNENRGCIGCHENRELAPDNKVPDAINNQPLTIPMTIPDINL